MTTNYVIKGTNKTSTIKTLKEVAMYTGIELIGNNFERAIKKLSNSYFQTQEIEVHFVKPSILDQKFYQDLTKKYGCAISIYNSDEDLYATYHHGKLEYTTQRIIDDLELEVKIYAKN